MQVRSHLLERQTYRAVLNGPPLDVLRRAVLIGGVSDLIASSAPAPLVVLTRRSDQEVDAVTLGCLKAGMTYVRVDVDRVSQEASLALDPQTELIELSVRGSRAQATPVVWIRHFDLDALEAPSIGDRRLSLYLRDQWQVALNLFGNLPNGHCVDTPFVTSRLDRVTQLRVADQVGFRRPRTLVTNRLPLVLQMLRDSSDGLIVKALGHHILETSPGILCGLMPRYIRDENDLPLVGIDEIEPAPVMYQDYVPARTELRVHVVGGKTFGFTVEKRTAEELWTDPSSITVTSVDVPPVIRAQIRHYVGLSGLTMGGFDFLMPDAGEPLFLEVNTSGDWRFFERRANSELVTQSVIDYFLDACRESR